MRITDIMYFNDMPKHLYKLFKTLKYRQPAIAAGCIVLTSFLLQKYNI